MIWVVETRGISGLLELEPEKIEECQRGMEALAQAARGKEPIIYAEMLRMIRMR